MLIKNERESFFKNFQNGLKMKCFFHETVDAVATCQSCGKSLCKECGAKYMPCACDECVSIQNNQNKFNTKQRKQDALIDTNAELISAIIKGIISALVLGTLYSITTPSEVQFSMYVMFFFVPFGWAVITYMEQWLPVIFMSGPIFIVYFLFKVAFSIVLGMFCFAFQILIYVFKMLKASSIK